MCGAIGHVTGGPVLLDRGRPSLGWLPTMTGHPGDIACLNAQNRTVGSPGPRTISPPLQQIGTCQMNSSVSEPTFEHRTDSLGVGNLLTDISWRAKSDPAALHTGPAEDLTSRGQRTRPAACPCAAHGFRPAIR